MFESGLSGLQAPWTRNYSRMFKRFLLRYAMSVTPQDFPRIIKEGCLYLRLSGPTVVWAYGRLGCRGLSRGDRSKLLLLLGCCGGAATVGRCGIACPGGCILKGRFPSNLLMVMSNSPVFKFMAAWLTANFSGVAPLA